jgi:hypothetical protein
MADKHVATARNGRQACGHGPQCIDFSIMLFVILRKNLQTLGSDDRMTLK